MLPVQARFRPFSKAAGAGDARFGPAAVRNPAVGSCCARRKRAKATATACARSAGSSVSHLSSRVRLGCGHPATDKECQEIVERIATLELEKRAEPRRQVGRRASRRDEEGARPQHAQGLRGQAHHRTGHAMRAQRQELPANRRRLLQMTRVALPGRGKRRLRQQLASLSCRAVHSRRWAAASAPSHDECDALLDHYVELLVNSDRPGTNAAELHKLQVLARDKAKDDPEFGALHGARVASRARLRDERGERRRARAVLTLTLLSDPRSSIDARHRYFESAFTAAGTSGRMRHEVRERDRRPRARGRAT